uniref:BRCA1-A complex subunit RAP80 n=1 Tax=Sinocyclocheilus anshuiensis TaxID=1608454 RepID=A0A671RUE5_9TELE
MPRRKRAADEGGRRAKVSRVEHNDEETLVISDSEHEEVCFSFRPDCAVLLVISEMTEEEMLDLAMRLSAQEANSAAQRQELEDNDIQKAIVESLNVGETFILIKATHSKNETTSPLPEMPDLSQTTSSHLSMRSSPAQVSSPPANTQVSC